MYRNKLIFTFFSFLWLVQSSLVFGQEDKPNKPNQNNILKLNVTALAQNKAMVFYEMELAHRSSLEFGAGYIYPNKIWANQFGATFLGTGFTLSGSFRQYFDKRYYSIPPKFRSYISPSLYYRHSSYDDEWFLIPHPNPALSECQLESRVFNQYGLSFLFGFQSRQGRVVFDFYSGLGVKLINTNFTLNAVTPGESCMITDSTVFYTNESANITDVAVTVHAGIKIGFRLGPYKEYPIEFESNTPMFEGNRKRRKRERFWANSH